MSCTVGGQLGGGVFDRLDPSSWLYPQPEGKADTATMRQLGAFALHVQNIPIRCFKYSAPSSCNIGYGVVDPIWVASFA